MLTYKPRWVHYSAAPLTKLNPVTPGGRRGKAVSDKPNGFWISDDAANESWLSWSIAERFGLDRFNYATRAYIRPGANILRIHSVEELDDFHAKYHAPIYEGQDQIDFQYIDWTPVCSQYDGIIITPYLWERRLGGPFWYYTWDCASGVIWNEKAIKLGKSRRFDISPYLKESDAA